eukprot:TRINITY_DN9321_c0_g3_i4.p1 TRINITY_DN9321_c0_g3~~TRINITY_DN9321_c0_g3_i4.p1  ORF type:complete len:368 (+),score=7.18 TRINITY_DN9321_c0_g3_i4:156-1259(+)
MDPRKVDFRSRHLAVLTILLLLCIGTGYVSYRLYEIWICGGRVLSLELSDTWGRLPTLRLCNRIENPVEFLSYSVVFRDFMYRHIPGPGPRYRVPEATYPDGWEQGRVCLLFNSSEDIIDKDVVFKVLYRESFNSSAPRVFEDITRSLLLEAYEADGSQKHSGTLDLLSSTNVPCADEPGSHSSRMYMLRLIQRRAELQNLTYTKYYSPDTRHYEMVNATVPMTLVDKKTTTQQPAPNEVCGPQWRLLQFAIYVPQPRVVRVTAETTKLAQTTSLAGGFGGLLTLTGILYTRCFPRKFERTNIAATNDIRTFFLFKTSEKPDERVNVDDEKYGEWRLRDVFSRSSRSKSEGPGSGGGLEMTATTPAH